MQEQTTGEDGRGGVLRRLARRFTDSGADRYSPFVQMRTFGRATTSQTATKNHTDDDCAHDAMTLPGAMMGGACCK